MEVRSPGLPKTVPTKEVEFGGPSATLLPQEVDFPGPRKLVPTEEVNISGLRKSLLTQEVELSGGGKSLLPREVLISRPRNSTSTAVEVLSGARKIEVSRGFCVLRHPISALPHRIQVGTTCRVVPFSPSVIRHQTLKELTCGRLLQTKNIWTCRREPGHSNTVEICGASFLSVSNILFEVLRQRIDGDNIVGF